MVDRVRQWRAQKQNIFIKEKRVTGEYNVSGSRGTEYQVTLSPDSCTCPDWKKRRPAGGCKHVLHVKMEKGLLDPLPSAKTNFGDPHTRSRSTYPANWNTLSRQTKKRDNWTCQKCGVQGGPYGSAKLAAHHMVPKSRGGNDEVKNLITICHSCHEAEHGHSIPDTVGYSGSAGGSRSGDTGFNISSRSVANSEGASIEDHSKDDHSSPKKSSTDRPEDKSTTTTATRQVATSDDSAEKERVQAPDPISGPPKMVKESRTPVDSLGDSLIRSMITLGILGMIVEVLSLGGLAWIGITVVSVFYFLFLRAGGELVEGKVDELREINEEIAPLLEKVNDEKGNTIQKETVVRVRELLKESDKIIPAVNTVVREEYVDWVSQSHRQLDNHLIAETGEEANGDSTTDSLDDRERQPDYPAKGIDQREMQRRYR